MQFTNGIINQLIIYGAVDNLPDVTIGPGPNIKFYDGTFPVMELGFVSAGTTKPEILIQTLLQDQLIMGFDNAANVPRVDFVNHLSSGQTNIYLDTAAAPVRDSFVISSQGNLGDISRIVLREDAAGFGEIVVSQEIVAENPTTSGSFPPTSETWHDFTLINGWSNFGGGYPNLRYRWLPYGYVAIEGTIAPGTTANGTTIATLPNLYRPVTIKRLQWLELGFLGFVDVQTNGNINIFGSAGTTTCSFETQFPLGIID